MPSLVATMYQGFAVPNCNKGSWLGKQSHGLCLLGSWKNVIMTSGPIII